MVWAHGTGMMFSGCPCINTIPHDSLSLLSGQTAMKLAINIPHVSGVDTAEIIFMVRGQRSRSFLIIVCELSYSLEGTISCV